MSWMWKILDVPLIFCVGVFFWDHEIAMNRSILSHLQVSLHHFILLDDVYYSSPA